MTTDAHAAGDTPLSIEHAAGLIGSETREKDDDTEARNPRPEDTGAERAEENPEVADEDESSDAAAENDANAEDPSADQSAEALAKAEAQSAKVDPPRWWNKDAKARFASLPPELQAVVFAQEDNRERVVQKAKQDAAEARKLADAHAAEMSQRLAVLDHLFPEAAQMFQGRWANVDWSTLPDKVGAEEAFKLKAQYERERDTLHALGALQQQAQADNFRKFVAAESEKLKSVAPDLADETHGAGRKQELGRFLLGAGFPADRIQYMSADEAAIAYDAMRWRQAQSKAQALSKKQPVQPLRPPVKPTAAARTSQSRSADDALRRLKTSGRVDDAIALLNARS